MNFKITVVQKLLFLGILLILSCFDINAQNGIWTKTNGNSKVSDVLCNNLDKNHLEVFDLNIEGLENN